MSSTINHETNKVVECKVTDKISAILVCQNVPGTVNAKPDRFGEQYLATHQLNPDLVKDLEAGFTYVATGKVDGTCCQIYDGEIHKRRDIKPGREIPQSWRQTGKSSDEKKHLIGFMSLEKGDKWYEDCYATFSDGNLDKSRVTALMINDSGTGLEYRDIEIKELEGQSVEVIGPKWQANPHNLERHCVILHGLIKLDNFPDLFGYVNHTKTNSPLDAIKEWFADSKQMPYLEGIVLHLSNGKMYKLHRHHLAINWKTDLSLDKIPITHTN